MTIAPPPPLPPQQADVASIRQAQEIGIVRYRAYRVHVLGASVLGSEELEPIFADADTVSNAVRALGRAYYDAGYPGAQIHYALVGEDLYVAVDLGELTDVQAPEALEPYFEDLPRGEPLTDRTFEKRRALAEAYAERARLYADTRLTADDGGRVLYITSHDSDARTFSAGAAFSNPGNRFVGRHFLDLEASLVGDSGDELDLLWSTGLTGLNDDARADEYYDETLTWSRVTPRGLFALTAHVVDYKQPTDTLTIDGDLEELQAAWSYPLAATFASRWIVDARVDYTRKRRSAPGLGESAQNERYPSVELGTDFTWTTLWAGLPWDLEVGLTLRKGLRSTTADSGAELDYLVWRPSARADAAIGDRVTASIAAAGQFGSDTTPEQSQWVLGGTNAIYAFLPGVAVGDSGGLALLQIEYRFPRYKGVEVRPRAFAEYGFARYETSLPGAPAHSVQLADIGVEIGARLHSWLEASLAGAIPLEDDDLSSAVRDDSDAGLLFRIALSY